MNKDFVKDITKIICKRTRKLPHNSIKQHTIISVNILRKKKQDLESNFISSENLFHTLHTHLICYSI